MSGCDDSLETAISESRSAITSTIRARQLNQTWFSSVPDEYRLAFLPVDTREETIPELDAAVHGFAKENREKMMLAIESHSGKMDWQVYRTFTGILP